MSENKCWLIFHPGNSFFKAFLKENFGHVSIITKDKYNWYCINVNDNRLHASIFNVGAKDDLIAVIKKDHPSNKIVEVHYECPNISTYYLIPTWLSCVTITKYYLGLHKWFIFTPYRLFRYLLKVKNGERHSKSLKKVIVL